MTELGGTLPDSAIQVRAITKISRAVLLQHQEVAFRINLARAKLRVDLVPDSEKVMKLHAQMLSELESMAHRGERDREKPPKEQVPPPPPSAKVKGVDAPSTSDSSPPQRPPRQPKGSQKGPPPKVGEQGVPGPIRTPCSFYSGTNGCKKGSECTFEHNWNGFSAAEKALRCKGCGSKNHKTSECKAGGKPEDKAKVKAPRQQGAPKSGPEAPPTYASTRGTRP